MQLGQQGMQPGTDIRPQEQTPPERPRLDLQAVGAGAAAQVCCWRMTWPAAAITLSVPGCLGFGLSELRLALVCGGAVPTSWNIKLVFSFFTAGAGMVKSGVAPEVPGENSSHE